MLKQHWKPVDKVDGKKVTVIFRIASNGTVTNIRVGHSSGIAIFDNAALTAVTKSALFPVYKGGNSPDVQSTFTGNENVETKFLSE